jgi:hypothetical protein
MIKVKVLIRRYLSLTPRKKAKQSIASNTKVTTKGLLAKDKLELDVYERVGPV